MGVQSAVGAKAEQAMPKVVPCGRLAGERNADVFETQTVCELCVGISRIGCTWLQL